MVDENSIQFKFRSDKKVIPSILLWENISTYEYGYYNYMFPYSKNRWAFDFVGVLELPNCMGVFPRA